MHASETMYNDFENWLDALLLGMDRTEDLAFNFNLYERNDSEHIDVQLTASEEYDPENDDWACRTCYSSEEDLFSFFADDWMSAMRIFRGLIAEYLNAGSNADLLKKGRAVTFCFVDGDLEAVQLCPDPRVPQVDIE